MNNRILASVFIAYISMFSMGSYASSSPQNAYNQNCLTGGQQSGSYVCNPNKLSQNQAHSYCVSISSSTQSDEYLDCMGSFLPFSGSSSRGHSCNQSSNAEITWSNSNTGVQCRGIIFAGDYSNLERISVATNTSSTGIGNASVVCRDGNFVVDRSNSICTEEAQSCNLTNEVFSWGATHIGQTQINETVRNSNVNHRFYPFDISDLGVRGDFGNLNNIGYGVVLSGTNKLIRSNDVLSVSGVGNSLSSLNFFNYILDRDYDQISNFVCQSSRTGNLSGYNHSVNLETYSQKPIYHNTNNVFSSGLINRVNFNGSVNGSYSVTPNRITTTNNINTLSEEYRIVSRSNDFNNNSYQVAYCYDGDINNAVSRDRFEFVNERLSSAGMMNSSKKDELEAVSCVVRPRDCSPFNVSIPAFDNKSRACDFTSNGIVRTGVGNNFMVKSNSQNLGSRSNPIIFEGNQTHGYASHSCFNGHTIIENTECYQTSICSSKNVEGLNYQEVVVSYSGILESDVELTENQIKSNILSASMRELKDKCKSEGIFEGANGKLKDDLFTYEYTYNPPTTSSAGEWVHLGYSYSGAVDRSYNIEQQGSGGLEDMPVCDESINNEVHEVYHVYCDRWGGCQIGHEPPVGPYYHRCEASTGEDTEGFYDFKIEHLCEYIAEPENTDEFCSLGYPENIGVNTEKEHYTWNCSNGLLASSCDGKEGSGDDKFGEPTSSCFSCGENEVFDSERGVCVGGREQAGERLVSANYYCDQGAPEVLDKHEDLMLFQCEEQYVNQLNSLNIEFTHTFYYNMVCAVLPGSTPGGEMDRWYSCPGVIFNTEVIEGNGNGNERDVCEGLGSRSGEIWVYNSFLKSCIPSGGATVEGGGQSMVSQCPSDPVLFTDEWVIAGAVTEGGRNLSSNDFKRFNEVSSKEYVLPDMLTKDVVISLDRVRLAANDGGHSSRGGNATGRARNAFYEYGCSEFVVEDFEEFSYTRSRVGSNRHYGVVIGRCPCSVSSNVEQCEQGTQPDIFSTSGGGSGGGGGGGGRDPEMPVIIVE